METLIFILSVFFMGFFSGNIYANFKAVRALNRFFKENGTNLEQEIKKLENPTLTVYELDVEELSGNLYLYTRDKTFICQGKSLEELAESCKKHKNIEYATVKFNNKFFMFVNGISKDYYE